MTASAVAMPMALPVLADAPGVRVRGEDGATIGIATADAVIRALAKESRVDAV